MGDADAAAGLQDQIELSREQRQLVEQLWRKLDHVQVDSADFELIERERAKAIGVLPRYQQRELAAIAHSGLQPYSDRAEELLVLANFLWIRKLARAGYYGLEPERIIQAGRAGIHQAILKWNSGIDAGFLTFAKDQIRGELADEARHLSTVGLQVKRIDAFYLIMAIRRRAAAEGRDLTLEQIAAEARVSVKMAADLLDWADTQWVPLDKHAEVPGAEQGHPYKLTESIGTIAVSDKDFSDSLAYKESLDQLRPAFEQLTALERAYAECLWDIEALEARDDVMRRGEIMEYLSTVDGRPMTADRYDALRLRTRMKLAEAARDLHEGVIYRGDDAIENSSFSEQLVRDQLHLREGETLKLDSGEEITLSDPLIRKATLRDLRALGEASGIVDSRGRLTQNGADMATHLAEVRAQQQMGREIGAQLGYGESTRISSGRPRRQVDGRLRGRSKVDVATLIGAGHLQAGEKLYASKTFKGDPKPKHFEAELGGDGTVTILKDGYDGSLNGKQFPSTSGAITACYRRVDGGWKNWKIDRDGRRVLLETVRDAYELALAKGSILPAEPEQQAALGDPPPLLSLVDASAAQAPAAEPGYGLGDSIERGGHGHYG